jgi:hypothetical protein
MHDGLVRVMGTCVDPGCRPTSRQKLGCTARRMPRHRGGMGVTTWYLVDRYYDPTTGQFLTVDPLVDETGQAYGYTGDVGSNSTSCLTRTLRVMRNVFNPAHRTQVAMRSGIEMCNLPGSSLRGVWRDLECLLPPHLQSQFQLRVLCPLQIQIRAST